ncbi:hypothetical protein N7462_006755 [Penicillium macrosclerotiorum]|uniref:uncharacterized protein n=1 Tax=Penicillium macrosclerotiorum TaxID=303699 RepID=UPI0025489DA7|nr:uncharacterized protein N7462_006755 [Penicillium macrosclerotiorum]KAJ5683590.1 hypothetical protein N7462_006755 [Penicillium macrosclerotiorum]
MGQGNLKFSWTSYEREILCCLYRFYSLNQDTLETLFSTIFRPKLQKLDFKNHKLPARTLHAQWCWMKRVGHSVWLRVHRETEFRLDDEWKHIIAHIESTAQSMKIVLHRKQVDIIDMSENTPTDASGRRWEFLDSVLVSSQSNSVENSPGSTDHISPQTESQSLVTAHGKVCFWCEREGRLPARNDLTDKPTGEEDEEHTGTLPKMHDGSRPPETPLDSTAEVAGVHSPLITNLSSPSPMLDLSGTPNLPSILYRWSNDDSQGVNTETLLLGECFAGENAGFYMPENVSQEEFLESFRLHVTNEKVKTPFISTFVGPLAPVHRALHHQKNAKVTIIDPFKVETPIYYAFPLACLTSTLKKGRWMGYGEYEIWGRVPAPAIIRCFQISDLEAIADGDSEIGKFLQLSVMRSHERCSAKLRKSLMKNTDSTADPTGVVDRLVKSLGVPEKYRKDVASGFQRSWTTLVEEIPRNGRESCTSGLNWVDSSPRARRNSADSSSTYKPSESDDGSCSSTSEETRSRSKSGSSDAELQAHDTPSPSCPSFSTCDSSHVLHDHGILDDEDLDGNPSPSEWPPIDENEALDAMPTPRFSWS